MKKRIFRIAILLLIVSTLIQFSGGIGSFFKPSTVRAFGELTVDFHVPTNNPIFTINNMAPGDSENRNVDVTNSGTLARFVSVKGIRTGGVGTTPKLETVLDLVIKDGSTPIYGTGSLTGAKTVADFFNESADLNGVRLNIINAGSSKTYNFKVTFLPASGNEFQAKSVIFDLTFGIITSDNLVINEVYYIVDNDHGMDSPKDRGILGINGNKITIKNTGNGSTNIITVDTNTACQILQSNNTSITTNILSQSNTGGNSTSTSTVNINTGSANSTVNVNISGPTNQASCGNKLGLNDEWIEIFNPTDRDISLKNWTITDNSGKSIKINANKKVKAGGFALISKSASTWKYWNENPNAIKLELGNQIGDGLDNNGDRLILKNSQGVETDRVSWGTDTSGFTPPATNPVVAIGKSTEREVPGLDTNKAEDWKEKNPTPGN